LGLSASAWWDVHFRKRAIMCKSTLTQKQRNAERQRDAEEPIEIAEVKQLLRGTWGY